MMQDAEASAVFDSLAKIAIGNGRGVLFCKDSWIAGRTATEIAAAVVDAVPTRLEDVRTGG